MQSFFEKFIKKSCNLTKNQEKTRLLQACNRLKLTKLAIYVKITILICHGGKNENT